MPGFRPTEPYNELPALPPAAALETHAVLKACIEARAALAELKVASRLIPNPAILINTIPLLEAQASSEIENIVTTSDALFRYAQIEDLATDAPTKEALRYRRALHEGFQSLRERPLGIGTALRVCSAIKRVEMQVRRVPGTALANAATGEVIYTPPVGESLLLDRLSNWERFVHEAREIDPLIRMAVAHYQFEAIHPFTDGNGRTGRILNLLLLVEQGLLELPVLYLSRDILRRRDEYYRGLQAVTAEGSEAAWQRWTMLMLEAVAHTARWTTDKIQAIAKLQDAAIEFVRARVPRIYSRELVEQLFVQPYCRIQNLVSAQVAQRQTASEYLKQLAAAGMLTEIKIGREKLFIHPNLLRLLTSDDHPVLAYGSAHAPRQPSETTPS